MDYLEIYKKFNEVEEIKDYIDDVTLLRHYYSTYQFVKMQEHVQKLMCKYALETAVWNTVNTSRPTTFEQYYINAENFLQTQGAVIVVKSVADYENWLNADEVMFIKSMIGQMEIR